MATKWGVYSAGKICHDFVISVNSLKSTDHKFVAVAARELSSAQDFAKKLEIPKAYGSYEELAKDPDVEVVYIGTINSEHLSAAKLMLENGKHVLVEKPLTLNTKQSEELFTLAKSKKLFSMEALWSRFLPSFEFVFDQISKGVIGDLYHVDVRFFGNNASMDRIAKKELGGGNTLDLGVYCINVVEQAFNGATPEKIAAIGHLNQNGVDLDVSVALQFKDNKTATLSTHGLVTGPSDGLIIGSKGTIRIISVNGSNQVYVNNEVHDFKYPDPILPYNFGPSMAGLCYQTNEVRKCIKAGLLESTRMSHTDSLTISKIEDEIRKQVGVVYDADK